MNRIRKGMEKFLRWLLAPFWAVLLGRAQATRQEPAVDAGRAARNNFTGRISGGLRVSRGTGGGRFAVWLN